MERICLDTGIVTGYLLNKKEIVEKIAKIEKTADVAVTPQIIFELFCFAEQSEKPEENKAVVHDIIKRVSVIQWSVGAAEQAAKVFSELSSQKKKTTLREIFLAVLVKENNYMLLTDDPETYESLGVKIYK